MSKLIISAILSIFLISFLAKAQPASQPPMFWDLFNRSVIEPWRHDWLSGCPLGSNYADIYNNDYLRFNHQSNCVALTSIDLGTYVMDFDMEIYDWNTTSPSDMMVVEWADTQGHVVSIRFNRVGNSIEIGQASIITDFLTSTFPFSFSASTPYNYSSINVYPWHISKRGDIIIIESDLSVPNYINWTISSPSYNVPLKEIVLATYNNGTAGFTYLDAISVRSIGEVKILPRLQIDVTPALTVSYGTEQIINCHATNHTGVPVILYYFGTPVSNPYKASLSQGTNYFECISNETDTYYPSSVSALTFVTGVPLSTIPSPIENASQPMPQMVNETEWREAGFGWALIFVSPLGLITVGTLIFSAIISRFAGAVFGIISFLFLWFILVLFTGLLPSWIFLVLVIISGFIVVSIFKGMLTK
mgnify:CR=1 FL=1